MQVATNEGLNEMSCVNKVILVGFVGRDPEVRPTKTGGDRMASLSLATTKKWTDKATGERKEVTNWHRVVVFGDALAGVVADYVKKGSRIYVEGELANRKWKDDAGKDRLATEIVLNGPGAKIVLCDRRQGERAPDAGGYDDYGSHGPLPDEAPPVEDIPY